ncbi:MAG: hypothetical protein K0R85_1460 [Devosia sp.]|nr:hypothetical protein [Devosia sp.]
MPSSSEQTRKTTTAIWRGLKCRCPQCGQGWLFHHYLEQVEHCAVCGEPLAYYRVGLILPLPLVYLYVLVPLAIIVPMAILPSCKGAIIGLLWAHGWSDEQDR